MKISAPSLKLDMVLSHVEVKHGLPVIVCKVGVYEAVTDLSRDDVRVLLRNLARPRVLGAFLRLAFRRDKSRT